MISVFVFPPVACVAMSTGSMPHWINALFGREFDPSVWKTLKEPNDHARIEMIDSLLASGRLDGLDRSQVLELLGPPHEGPYFRDWDLVYYLGPERGGFRIDSEWLVLRFRSDGRLGEKRIVTD